MLGGLPSGPSFNDMSDFSLEGSDEADSPRSLGGHKGAVILSKSSNFMSLSFCIVVVCFIILFYIYSCCW